MKGRGREKNGTRVPDASGKKIETRVCATKGARLTRAHAPPLCIQPPSLQHPLSHSLFLSLFPSLSFFPSFAVSLYLPHVSAGEIYLAMRERETRNLHACTGECEMHIRGRVCVHENPAGSRRGSDVQSVLERKREGRKRKRGKRQGQIGRR